MDHQPQDRPARILRLPEVQRRTGRSRSALYRDLAEQRFPRPCRIGPRAIGWPESTIEAWIASRASVTAAAAGPK